MAEDIRVGDLVLVDGAGNPYTHVPRVAKHAKNDLQGRRIDTTYATKADVASEFGEVRSDQSDLTDRIEAAESGKQSNILVGGKVATLAVKTPSTAPSAPPAGTYSEVEATVNGVRTNLMASTSKFSEKDWLGNTIHDTYMKPTGSYTMTGSVAFDKELGVAEPESPGKAVPTGEEVTVPVRYFLLTGQATVPDNAGSVTVPMGKTVHTVVSISIADSAGPRQIHTHWTISDNGKGVVLDGIEGLKGTVTVYAV